MAGLAPSLILFATASAALVAVVTFATRSPVTDLSVMGRWVALCGVLALAVLVPVLLSLRADHLRVPLRRAGRAILYEMPLEASILAMFTVSLAVSLFPFGRALTAMEVALLLGIVALGVAAGATQQLWGYALRRPAP